MNPPTNITAQLTSGWKRLNTKVLVTIALAAFADWLHPFGITFSLFLIALAIGIVISNPASIDRRALSIGTLILSLAILPGIETFNVLSALIGIMGLIIFALIVHRQFEGDTFTRMHNTARFLCPFPYRFLSDAKNWFDKTKAQKPALFNKKLISLWIVPIGFSLGFLSLFYAGNPLIENWLSGIDLSYLISNINPDRILFWLIIVMICWPFIQLKLHEKFKWQSPAITTTSRGVADHEENDWFSQGAILRSLLLFNVLFAVQTTLDVTYLWGGVALPDGMSHATYAHRGAYPLIVTALLAAAFVLFVTRPGSGSEKSPAIRRLVLLWVAQNGLLVLSSGLRLNLYVEAFSLTYLRVAALIWMILVFIGLVLIIAKTALGRPNAWLIKTNLIALALVLYATSLVNLPALIADYNVSMAIKDKNKALDVHYLYELGPDALPAIDIVIHTEDALKYNWKIPIYLIHNFSQRRNRMAIQFQRESNNWRLWSFRNFRLQRYLDTAKPVKIHSPNPLRKHPQPKFQMLDCGAVATADLCGAH